MLNVQKKQIKTIDDYRHNIKLLKYHLKKQQKTHDRLRYQQAKSRHNKGNGTNQAQQNRHKIYSLSDTVRTISVRLKRMGLILEDLFRMTDNTYEGQINKQQFMKTIFRLKTDLDQSLFTEMFYAIDTSLDGLISEEQFAQFSIVYGGCTNTKQIRKFQKKIKNKLGNSISKKYGTIQAFLSKFPDPIPINTFQKQLKNLSLTDNEAMVMMKTFDPSQLGSINHKLFLSLMDKMKFKTQKQQKQEQYNKDIQQLCAYWRDHKMNPIVIFQEADVDGTQGVSVFQLQQAFKKLIPGQTNFQIKKWVSMINLNNDNYVTKQQFLNSIRSFYSLNQMSKFSSQYTKLHPQLSLDSKQQSIEQIMKQLSIKIQDSGMTKKQTFDFIDFNKNGQLSKEEVVEGLKRMGMDGNFVGRVVSVFDRDCSGQISLEQWLRVLGQDVEVSDVAMPSDMDQFMNENAVGDKGKSGKGQGMNKKKQVKKQIKKQTKKQAKKQEKKIPKTSQTEDKSIKKPQLVKSIEKKPIIPDKTIKNKTSIVPKQNSNITNKMNQSVKKIQVDSKKKGILQKKFTQDENKSKVIKQTQKQPDNKTVIKQVVKKQSKIIPKKTIAKPPSSQSQQEQNMQQQQQINIDGIQQKIGQYYKQNKRKIKKQFEVRDQNKKGTLKVHQFTDVLYKIGLMVKIQVSPQQAKEVFMRYCVDGAYVKYVDWLQEIKEMCAQDIDSVAEQKEQQTNPVKKVDSIKTVDSKKVEKKESKISQTKKVKQQEQPQQVQQQNYSQDYDNDDNNMQVYEKQQTIKQNNKNNNNNNNNNNSKQKRGSQINAFAVLSNNLIAIEEGVKNDKGYKLVDYIDNGGNNLKQQRDKLIMKGQQLKKNKKKFVDKQFPAQKKSIISTSKDCKIANVSLIKWKHFSEIFKNPKLIQGTIQPNDILQGGLGDCYFLCALACLSEYANMVQRLFQYYDLQAGYFLVWLCIDGQWRLLQIDGYIPVGPDNKPAFSRTSQDQLWVLLLEKAYAKAYGDYNNIVGGQPYQAIKDLSGAPGMTYDHKKISINEIWQKLLDANKKQYMMTAGTAADVGDGRKMDGRQQGVTTEGVVLGHAYSILDCQEFNGEKILQLRNPWGMTEWVGQWSDKSSKWTGQVKKKLKYQGKEEDGIFWMPLQSFYKNFITTSINYLRPNHYYDSCMQKNIKQLAIKLRAQQFTNGCIMASQIDHRHKGLPSNTPYSLMSMIGFVISSDGKITRKIDEKRFLYERQGMIEFTGVQNQAKGSEVVAMICLDSSSDVIVGYYGDKKIELEVDNKCIQYLEKLALYDENGPNAQVSGPIKCWLTQVQGIGFLCFKNVSGQTIKLSVIVDTPQNLQILPPNSKQNKQSIKPNCLYTIRGKVLDPKKGFNFCQKIQLSQ